MSDPVSWEFAQIYKKMCVAVEELAVTPEAYMMHRCAWLGDEEKSIGVKCYYSGVIRFFGNKNALLAATNTPWETAMAIYALSGCSYDALRKNHFSLEKEIAELWATKRVGDEQKKWLTNKGIQIPTGF